MNDEAVKWLREQVTQRMETAKEACHEGEGNWWRRRQALYVDREPVPAGALFEGTPEVDDPEHDIFLAEIVVYDEGRPSDAQVAHMALNDPQDVIARCEAELAILAAYDEACKVAEFPDEAGGFANGLDEAVKLLGSGYRHREGYAEHCGEAGQPSWDYFPRAL